MERLIQLFAFTVAMLAATLAWGEVLPVESARHVGTWSTSQVQWDSTFVIGEHARPNQEIAFAQVLPAEANVRFPHEKHEVLRDAAGRILGFRLDGYPPARVNMETVIPTLKSDPPLAPLAVQRIELVKARVRPGPGSPLRLRLTDVRHRAVSGEVAARLDFEFGEAVGSARPVVLIPDAAYISSGGLAPWLQSDAEAQRASIATLTGVLFVVLAIIFVAVRLLRRAARAEEAEAFLAEFGDDLDFGPSRADALG